MWQPELLDLGQLVPAELICLPEAMLRGLALQVLLPAQAALLGEIAAEGPERHLAAFENLVQHFVRTPDRLVGTELFLGLLEQPLSAGKVPLGQVELAGFLADGGELRDVTRLQIEIEGMRAGVHPSFLEGRIAVLIVQFAQPGKFGAPVGKGQQTAIGQLRVGSVGGGTDPPYRLFEGLASRQGLFQSVKFAPQLLGREGRQHRQGHLRVRREPSAELCLQFDAGLVGGPLDRLGALHGLNRHHDLPRQAPAHGGQFAPQRRQRPAQRVVGADIDTVALAAVN